MVHNQEMRRNDQHIPVKIAYIGGGSTNWAIKLMADLAVDDRLAAEVRLFDIDKSAADRNAAIGNRFADCSNGAAARYKSYSSLEEALNGAEIVVISILPGSLDDMAADIEIPARYGVSQSVGDTVGPGGFMRAMRAIPMIADIGLAIKRCSPDAYVCNLTNPMSVLTGALHKVFPGIRAWGECHEVTKIRKLVAALANKNADSASFTHRDVEVNVLGINHFTFVDKISVRGKDMLPQYREFSNENRQSGWTDPSEISSDAEHDRFFGSRNLVSFDLLQRFGMPAAAGDRHLAEFLPGRYYLEDPESWGFALTPIEYRKKDRAIKIARLEQAARGEAPLFGKKSDEALTDQIVALMSGQPFISNVNLPNVGQIAGLADGTIVETNAVFSGRGIQPIFSGSLPPALLEIIKDHAQRQTNLLDAVLTSDVAPLVELFASDPLVRHLPKAQARALYTQMVAATSHLLPKEIARAA
ncbi:alpha-galactosidase [Maritalea porphyrae]